MALKMNRKCSHAQRPGIGQSCSGHYPLVSTGGTQRAMVSRSPRPPRPERLIQGSRQASPPRRVRDACGHSGIFPWSGKPESQNQTVTQLAHHPKTHQCRGITVVTSLPRAQPTTSRAAQRSAQREATRRESVSSSLLKKSSYQSAGH